MVKILIVRLSSLGDIIHTYPMLDDIKINLCNVEIDWLVDESFKDLLKYNKNINQIISIPLRKWKKNKLNIISNIIDWNRSLSNKKYDYIIDSQGLFKSAILTKFFIGKVYGFDFFSIKEKFACFFYKNRINVSKNYLATLRNRILCSKIFNYQIDLGKINFGLQRNLINNMGYPYKYVIFFHATSRDNKKYSFENWLKIAKYIIKNNNYTIILPYGNMFEKNESLELKKLINSDNVKVPDNIFNFNELHQLINGAEFVIGVDTGLIHLANALNKKTIAIFISTDPKKTGIIESDISRNIGNINLMPKAEHIIELYKNIINMTSN